MSTCGMNGGRTRRGSYCQRPAGWGTDHKGEGRCKRHDQVANAKLQAQKAKFLLVYTPGAVEVRTREGELMPPGSITVRRAAAEVGVDQSTIWRWRQDDPEFDQAFLAVKRLVNKTRLDNWEDSAYVRVLSGNAAPTLEIFYATNLARQVESDAWLHASHVTLAGDKDNPLTPVFVVPEPLSVEDWAERYGKKEEAA